MDNQATMNVNVQEPHIANDTLKQTRRHFSKLGLMFFLGTLLINIVQIIAVAVANIIDPTLLSETTTYMLITMLPMYLIAMPLMALMIRTVPASDKIEEKKMSVGQWILSFLICYGLMYLSNYIGNTLTTIISTIKGTPVTNTINTIITSSSIWCNFIIMVIFAPITEELLFRKMLIDRTRKYGDCVSILISGVMFGLFHGNLNQFVYAFALGMCYAFIYLKTGRVRYTIYLHMLNNFLGSVLGMIVLKAVGNELVDISDDFEAMMVYMSDHMAQVLILMLYMFALFAVAITGIVLFFVNLKKIKMQIVPGEVTIPKGKRFTTTVLNVGMALFFIFWIIMIIVQLLA